MLQKEGSHEMDDGMSTPEKWGALGLLLIGVVFAVLMFCM